MKRKYIYTLMENWRYLHLRTRMVNTTLAKCHKENIMWW